jgi:hypothetical protein
MNLHQLSVKLDELIEFSYRGVQSIKAGFGEIPNSPNWLSGFTIPGRKTPEAKKVANQLTGRRYLMRNKRMQARVPEFYKSAKEQAEENIRSIVDPKGPWMWGRLR